MHFLPFFHLVHIYHGKPSKFVCCVDDESKQNIFASLHYIYGFYNALDFSSKTIVRAKLIKL